MRQYLSVPLLLCTLLLPVLMFSQRKSRILDHRDRIRITRMSVLNSPYRETNLSITPDGKYLFFMSMRGGQSWSNSYMKFQGQDVYDGDIWYTEKRNGQWVSPRCMPESINTSSGEDEPNISKDGNTVYYQSWNSLWKFTGGPYYKARRNGRSWSSPEGLGGGITAFFETMRATDGMTISPDEQTFIVAAARDDYDENMDLYISHKGRYGWRYCRKLPISTPGDERSVFLAGDGKTLYFASDGYGGLGGLDIYKTTLINDSTFGEVINLGPPFNTPKDDFGFILTADGNEAYFVRDGDIYFADLTEADEAIKPTLPSNVRVVLKGTVRDSSNWQGMQANIILLDAKTKRLIKKVSANSRGQYEIELPNKNRSYDQLVFQDGYKKARKQLVVSSSIEDQVYQKNFLLAPLRPAAPEPPPVAENPPTPPPAEAPVEEPPAEEEKPQITQIKPQPPNTDIETRPEVPDIEVEEVENPYSFEGVARNNLILLLDVSASMRKPDKLPLLKTAFSRMLQHMRPEDRISVIVYSGDARVVLSGVSAVQRDYIIEQIDKLRSGGSTKGKGALRKAYKIAEENFLSGGNNRIIMATDGDFDVPNLYSIAQRNAERNINLSVFAFGKLGERRLEELETLAQKGKGNFASISRFNIDEALLKEAKAVRKR